MPFFRMSLACHRTLWASRSPVSATSLRKSFVAAVARVDVHDQVCGPQAHAEVAAAGAGLGDHGRGVVAAVRPVLVPGRLAAATQGDGPVAAPHQELRVAERWRIGGAKGGMILLVGLHAHLHLQCLLHASDLTRRGGLLSCGHGSALQVRAAALQVGAEIPHPVADGPDADADVGRPVLRALGAAPRQREGAEAQQGRGLAVGHEGVARQLVQGGQLAGGEGLDVVPAFAGGGGVAHRESPEAVALRRRP